MKTFKYIALAALALGFAACSQDGDFAPQQEDIVKIASANIATEVQTRVNTLEDGTAWETDDRILLVNSSRTANKNSGTYTYNGTAWSLTEGLVLYASSGTNNFTAYYPAVGEEAYILPAEQNTMESIKYADRMVGTASNVAKGAAVELSFERQNAMITITPKLNSEFATGTTISSFQIAGITAYHPEGATDYKAIIAPTDGGFSVSVSVSNQELTTTSSVKIEAGKHYTFNLTVGKEAVIIDKVSVTQWTEKPITGVESDEYFLPVDATTMSAYELQDAVEKILKGHQSDVTVTLAANAGTEMFTALRTAFAESTVPDGSVNLTIAGVKTIPEYAFLDQNEYDEIYKNTAGDKLKSLTLTDAETIGYMSFICCSYLTSLNIPKVITIDIFAFAYCSSLTSVDLTKVVTLGNNAFEYCDLRTIVLSEATTIGGCVFGYNENLVSCSAPKATEIGYYPWGNCEKLETLELTAAGTFTLANNLFAYTPTEQIKLVLNSDKEAEVTKNEDGTATWNTKNKNNGTMKFTFKSIEFVD